MKNFKLVTILSIILNISLGLLVYSYSMKDNSEDYYKSSLKMQVDAVIKSEGHDPKMYKPFKSMPIFTGHNLECAFLQNGEWHEAYCFYREGGKFFGRL